MLDGVIIIFGLKKEMNGKRLSGPTEDYSNL